MVQLRCELGRWGGSDKQQHRHRQHAQAQGLQLAHRALPRGTVGGGMAMSKDGTGASHRGGHRHSNTNCHPFKDQLPPRGGGHPDAPTSTSAAAAAVLNRFAEFSEANNNSNPFTYGGSAVALVGRHHHHHHHHHHHRGGGPGAPPGGPSAPDVGGGGAKVYCEPLQINWDYFAPSPRVEPEPEPEPVGGPGELGLPLPAGDTGEITTW